MGKHKLICAENSEYLSNAMHPTNRKALFAKSLETTKCMLWILLAGMVLLCINGCTSSSESKVDPEGTSEKQELSTPSISGSCGQWGLQEMGFDILLEAAQKGQIPKDEVICAVIDMGFTGIQPTSTNRISSNSRSFIGDDTLEGGETDGNHGTAVASVIMQATPDNVTLLLLKVGRGADDAVCDAIEYALDCGASVINMSFDLNVANAQTNSLIPVKEWSSLPKFDEKIKLCEEKGVPFVVASGNNGDNGGDAMCHYPAASEHVITVGALKRDLTLCEWSNTGECVDYAAPGNDILFSQQEGNEEKYYFSEGTSLSAPFVSAAITYVKMHNPKASVDEVRDALTSCSMHLGEKGWNRQYGWGMPVISKYVLGSESRASHPLKLAKVIDATEGNAGEDATNLFGDVRGSKWCVSAPKGAFVEWEEPEAIAPSRINLVSANDNSIYPGRNPGKARLLSRADSNDKWHLIWEMPSGLVLPDEDYRLFSFEIDGQTAPAKLYRLEIDPLQSEANGVMQLSCVELIP